MKKAILIICVLSVLALLAVPMVAGVLIAEGDLAHQICPPPGVYRQAGVQRPTQIARSYPPPQFRQS
jgi:hypothetical protein